MLDFAGRTVDVDSIRAALDCADPLGSVNKIFVFNFDTAGVGRTLAGAEQFDSVVSQNKERLVVLMDAKMADSFFFASTLTKQHGGDNDDPLINLADFTS